MAMVPFFGTKAFAVRVKSKQAVPLGVIRDRVGPRASSGHVRYAAEGGSWGRSAVNFIVWLPCLPCPPHAPQSSARHPATAAAAPSPHPVARASIRRAPRLSVRITGMAFGWRDRSW